MSEGQREAVGREYVKAGCLEKGTFLQGIFEGKEST